MRILMFLSFFLLQGCTLGYHVGYTMISMTKFQCRYSPSIFIADRVIAMCATEDECNKICAEAAAKDGK